MPRRPSTLVLAVYAIVQTAGLTASAQAGGQGAEAKFPPERLVNVKVLPKGATPGDAISVMKTFTQALGVRCPFCHVGEEGKPLTSFDFVADTKPQKNIAREMVRLTNEINERLGALPAGSAARQQVTCATCHHGSARPPAF